MVLKFVLCIALSLSIIPSAFGQSAVQVFPQIADGFAGSLTYKSSVMVRNASESTSVDCTVRLFGLRVTAIALRRGALIGPSTSFTFTSIGASGWVYLSTTGQQAIATGYATLTCTGPVFAQVLYSLYSDNTKVGETTVFAAEEAERAQLIADQTEGSRLGVAIANNTDTTHDYRINAFDVDANIVGTETVRIGPRSALAKFLDELLPATVNTLGSVTLRSTDGSIFSATGVRFSGAVFAAIPATR